MPLYSYEAVDSRGRKVKETLSSSDEATLKTTLRSMGLIPISIRAAEAKKSFFYQRISTKDLLTFTQELGNLLDAGLPIDRALYTLSEHSENRAFRMIIKEVSIEIQRGGTLSSSLAKHRVFPRVYVNMIRAGESGGMLDAVIKRLVVFLETTTTFKDEIISALIYPILLSLVGGLAVAVLMLYVIPNFSQIFSDMGQALPLPTMILIRTSEFFAAYWWALLGALAGGAVLLRAYLTTAEGKTFLDTALVSLPAVKKVTIKFIIARFSRTLGTLLQSGVPILEAIKISREVIDNDVVSQRLKVLEEGVSKGRGISAPLRESQVFPPIFNQMVAVGEEAGRLEDTFLLIAERFEVETKNLIKRFVSLFEPALILVMGLVVGFIVISMLIGIFSINEMPL
ncbi:MAG: type II secretion system F family protein [Thermodesulfovibrionales bacterium]